MATPCWCKTLTQADVEDAMNAPANPAEIYDTQFAPALFDHWGPIVVTAAKVKPGDRVLDVACGAGAATLAAAERAGPSGHVVGLDVNPEMLAVARSKPTLIEWVEAPAEAIPISDASFDAVISQFGLMFFSDKKKALAEMMRVLRPGGAMAIAVCDAVENSPGYGAFARLLDRLFGAEVGDAFRAPFALGDADRLRALCEQAGLAGAEVTRHHAEVRFPSITAMVSTERACVWTLGGMLNEAQFERLLAEAKAELAPLTLENGAIHFDMPALFVTITKA
jgi:ubiquinone/menaquinone biosynthesis C-methylase UbiE